VVVEQYVAGVEAPGLDQLQADPSFTVLNSDLPAPITTGFTMIRGSSTSPISRRLTVSSELPKDRYLLAGLLLERRELLRGVDEPRTRPVRLCRARARRRASECCSSSPRLSGRPPPQA
jgi:hypothetical protein